MKKIFRTIAAVALVGAIAFTPSCNKYPDGPSITVLTKKARISGDWTMESATINGNPVSVQSGTLTIKKDGTYTSTIGGGTETGKWEFSSDKSQVISTPEGSSTAETQTILRLENKSMWLKEVYGGATFEAHYKQ